MQGPEQAKRDDAASGQPLRAEPALPAAPCSLVPRKPEPESAPSLAQPLPVLNYAGPFSNTVLRLPTRRILDRSVLPDGVAITERRTGKASALAGLAFGVFVLVVLAISIINYADYIANWRAWELQGNLVFMIVVWCVVALFVPLVVDNTWSRTIVEARPGSLSLTYRSPYRCRRRSWPAQEVGNIDVASSGERPTRWVDLLEIRVGGRVLRLFAGHPRDALMDAAADLRRILETPVVPLPMDAPVTAAPPGSAAHGEVRSGQ